MSLIDDAASDAGTDNGRRADDATGPYFRFLPSDLTGKCRKLIESYHAIHGQGCLPDMLWHSDARNVIESHSDLARTFRSASKSRAAKRAHDSLLLIATIVFSLEVLARDFAGWGKRFPAAKREAEKMLGDFPLKERNWLMDMYLYPNPGIHRELVRTLSPAGAGEQTTARN